MNVMSNFVTELKNELAIHRHSTTKRNNEQKVIEINIDKMCLRFFKNNLLNCRIVMCIVPYEVVHAHVSTNN